MEKRIRIKGHEEKGPRPLKLDLCTQPDLKVCGAHTGRTFSKMSMDPERKAASPVDGIFIDTFQGPS